MAWWMLLDRSGVLRQRRIPASRGSRSFVLKRTRLEVQEVHANRRFRPIYTRKLTTQRATLTEKNFKKETFP